MTVFAAIVLGAASPAEVATRTGFSALTVSSALRRLTDGGLVTSTDGRLTAQVEAFKAAARRSPRAEVLAHRRPRRPSMIAAIMI